MKKLLSLFLPLLICGCNNSGQKAKTLGLIDTSDTYVKNNMVLPDDTVSIIIDSSSRTTYPWGKLQKIVKTYPELDSATPVPPDKAYQESEARKVPQNLSFKSEVDEDNYMLLYAYYLKKRIGTKNSLQIKQLIKIYEDINQVYTILAQGGTYFVHQYRRIPAYAAYSFYILNKQKLSDMDITQQKSLFIDSLNQIIVKTIDNSGIQKNQQEESKNKLFDITRDISHLIKNNLYLKGAQEFRHAYYKNLPL